jgi:ADP-ribose pyrophosphatase YjhB (NUDIX family)
MNPTPDEPIEDAYRFCPRCGNKNEQPGRIPFYCTKCEMGSYFGPVAAVAALVTNQDGQLLLVRRSRQPGKGLWGLPGGFIDRDETAEQALAREVVEETNLKVVRHELLMTYPNHYHYRGIIIPVIDLFYECEIDDVHQLRLAPDELDHHKWGIPDKSDLDRMAFDSNRRAIEFWISRL